MAKKKPAAASNRKPKPVAKPDAKPDTMCKPKAQPDGQPDAKPDGKPKTSVELKKWKTFYKEDDASGNKWKANLCGLYWDLDSGEVEERWRWKPEVAPDKGNGKGKGKGKGKEKDDAK